MKIIYLGRTDSTNHYAQKYVRQHGTTEPVCIVASEQTAGKGQGKNSWHSEKGKNLCCSFVYSPKIKPQNQFVISKQISLSIIGFLEKYHRGFQIKWPNDIYLADKKIAGILIENTLSGNSIKHCIAGIGININQTEFPSDLPNPISLSMITKDRYNLIKCISELSLSIEQSIYKLSTDENPEIDSHYLSRLYRYREKSQFADKAGEFTGTILGIGEYGHLLVENNETGEQKKYDFKEIVFL